MAPRNAGQAPGQRRRELLEAARAEMSRRGVAATTLNDIARAADMSAPALYWHFADRQQLVQEAIREHGEDFARLLLDQSSTGTGLERIEHHLETWARYVEESGEATIRFHFRAVVEARDQPELWGVLEPIVAAARVFWRAHVDDGIEDGSIRSDLDVEGTVELLLAATAGLDFCASFTLSERGVVELYGSFTAMLHDHLTAGRPPSR